MSLLPYIGINFNNVSRPIKNVDIILSSLMLLIPSIFFAANKNYTFAILLALASFFSIQCDGYDKMCKFDNIFMFLLIFVFFYHHHINNRPFDWIFWIKIIGAWLLLKYSSLSKTKEEWYWRHSFWHIIIVIIFLSEI